MSPTLFFVVSAQLTRAQSLLFQELKNSYHGYTGPKCVNNSNKGIRRVEIRSSVSIYSTDVKGSPTCSHNSGT